MHIHNPTDERITPMHASRTYTFEPRKTIPVEDKAAMNHIINEYGARGLVLLDFGDDTREGVGGKTIFENKAAAGRAANETFRRNMVINHNQMNESNKHTRKPYIMPTDQLTKYAADLGIKLIKPYEVDDIQQQEMNKMKLESEGLKDLIKTQSGQITELLEAIKSGGLPAPATKTVEEVATDSKADELKEMIAKVNSHNRKDYFKKWYDDNLNDIKMWPEEAKTEVRKKYTAMLGGEAHI